MERTAEDRSVSEGGFRKPVTVWRYGASNLDEGIWMRRAAPTLAAMLAFAFACPALAQTTTTPIAPPSDKFKDPQSQASYAIGVNLGSGLRREQIAIDPEILAQGVRDALVGGPMQMTDEEVRATLSRLQAGIQARQAEATARAAEANNAAGAAFLKANGAKPGVVTLSSGLQYEVLTAGSGPKPKLSDVVSCNYRGTLIDGTEFDSSYKRGAPISFPVSGVIPGWTEALQLMTVGSKWRLFVPSALAYGDKGSGTNIGPNSVLIFEVELLSIESRD